jgi:hypothetical protein
MTMLTELLSTRAGWVNADMLWIHLKKENFTNIDLFPNFVPSFANILLVKSIFLDDDAINSVMFLDS